MIGMRAISIAISGLDVYGFGFVVLCRVAGGEALLQ
jgi:hypothetical protein